MGEVIGWCGQRDVAQRISTLLFLRLPDMRLKTIKCVGAGPDGYMFPSAELDPVEMTFYVFGGWPSGVHPTSDLYRIRLTNYPLKWEKIDTQGAWPEPRNGAPMVFDQGRRRLILCGGDGGSIREFRPLRDCWQFDIATARWTKIPDSGQQPPARWHACMAVDQDSQKAYLFGGAGSKVRFDATFYELDLRTDTWRRLRTKGSAPPSLQGATLTFDETHRVLVLAGGLRHSGVGPATFSTVWVFDPATGQWDETDCGEDLRRRDHLGVYDPSTGNHILIGGRITSMVGNFYGKGSKAHLDVCVKVRPVAP
jgi:hypothetical protein